MKLVLAIVFSPFLFVLGASSWAADLGDMTALRKQPLDDEVLGASRKVPSVSLDGGEMTAGRLRVEYLEPPQGIDAAQPRLSWELRDTRRGARQTAYRILVASDAGRLATDDGNLWDSGKVASTETLGIEYAGTSLTSRQRCFWKVQVWDADDRASAWSAPAEWSMGLLAASDWKAHWITAPSVESVTTAHFGYRSKQAPSVDTAKWVQIDLGETQTFDAVRISDDRWLLAQLEIEYEDGTRETVVTDRSWTCHTDGPIRRALIFDGFEYDAGKEIPGWTAPGFEETGEWKTVVEQPVAESPALSAQAMEPIRVRRELKPVARTEPAPGVFVFDFGEQLSGVYQWIIAHVAGIQPDPANPGYKRFLVAPRAEAGPEWVKAEYRSIRGPAGVNWKRLPDALELHLAVPPNTIAEVRIPTSAPDAVTESGRPAGQSPGVTFLRKEKDAAVFEVGSGQYAFRAAKPPSPAAAADPGFVRIAEHGAGLTLKGRPYRAIGINIPHLPQAWMGTWFHRNQFYASPEAMRQAMVEAIEDAARHRVAFIRFFGSPGYPKETAEIYHKDKAAYWRQMDELFALCRNHELKLVPSLGVLSKWHQEFGEPRSAVFDPKSKTHAATYGYVREFVTRYRDDPTVLMWELENEAFLKADVVVEGQPGLPAGVFPEGFATRRETYTAADNLRFEQLVDFYKEIAAFIKELDPNHLVTSGDSGVRPESQARRDTFPKFRWRKDTLREHLANLLVSQPEPLDVFSLHEYGNFTAVTDVGRLAELELLRAKVRAVHAARAPVFIGELGQRDPHLAQDTEAKWTRAAIDLLDEEGVALIALWVWHFPWQEADHNITTGAEQPLLMRRVGEFNRTSASAPPQ